jgi:hypothetical protein
MIGGWCIAEVVVKLPFYYPTGAIIWVKLGGFWLRDIEMRALLDCCIANALLFIFCNYICYCCIPPFACYYNIYMTRATLFSSYAGGGGFGMFLLLILRIFSSRVSSFFGGIPAAPFTLCYWRLLFIVLRMLELFLAMIMFPAPWSPIDMWFCRSLYWSYAWRSCMPVMPPELPLGIFIEWDWCAPVWPLAPPPVFVLFEWWLWFRFCYC